MSGTAREGFTLVELTIVMVITAILMGATYQVLVTNQRVSTVQHEQVQVQQTVRASLDLLSAELRELSPTAGDILEMGENRIEVRVQRRFGIVCAVNSGLLTEEFLVRGYGTGFEEGDEVAIFADNDPDTADDDVWLYGSVGSVGATEDCPGGVEGQTLALAGLGSLLDTNQVHPGAPLRSFETFEYGLFEVEGRPYLGRRSGTGGVDPLAGPVRADDGVAFEYVGSDGSEVTDPVEVRSIRLIVRAASDATRPNGARVGESLSVSIHTRN